MIGVFTPDWSDEQRQALVSSDAGALSFYLAPKWKPEDGFGMMSKAIVVGDYPVLRQALKDAGIPVYERLESGQKEKVFAPERPLTLPLFEGIYTGKRVAIVGPAPHITKRPQVKKLKGYDIIVRINSSYPVHPNVAKMTTNRTDVWYPCLPFVRDGKMHGGAIIRTESMHHERVVGFQYSEMTTNPKHLDHVTGCRTNRGFMAIMDVINEEPKELYITGITFYKGVAYHDEYLNDPEYLKYTTDVQGHIGEHNPDAQLKYFAQNVAILPNVTMDKELHHVLSEFKAQTTR
jgi:hypothetical protein